jgi:hypothetical protein
MSYNLFLDDIRQPVQVGNYMLPVELRGLYRKLHWVIVRNYNEFVRYIEDHGLPQLISFDHDLAEVHYDPSTTRESIEFYPETGLDCMKWMIEYIQDRVLKPPTVLVHSMNPDGRENIEKLFQNFLKHYKWDDSNESDIQMGR